MSGKLLFATVEVTRQAFFRNSLSYAIVNLKPLVPGHVLVLSKRVVPRLTDLTEQELSSLMSSVKTVGNVVERAYGADGLTIACQDGKAAGQTMPHVHFHILPRKFHGDHFSGRNDDIYPALESSEAQIPQVHTANGYSEPLKVDADENRPARTLEEMEQEANWLKGFFPSKPE